MQGFIVLTKTDKGVKVSAFEGRLAVQDIFQMITILSDIAQQGMKHEQDKIAMLQKKDE